MADRMNDQRAANQDWRNQEQDRSLARRDEGQRGLARYSTGLSPFELMRRFSDDVDRMFASFGFPSVGSLLRPTATTGMTAWSPTVDVFQRGDDLVVRADLPGIKPEDVNIEAEGNNLIISGESRAEKEDKDKGYWYSERRYGSFYRTIPLPEGVNTDNAKAQFNNGVLEVTLPDAAKTLQPQRRRINVQGASQGTTTGTGTGPQPTTTTTTGDTGEQRTTTT